MPQEPDPQAPSQDEGQPSVEPTPTVNEQPRPAQEPAAPNFFAEPVAEATPELTPVAAPAIAPEVAPKKKMKKPLFLGIIIAAAAVVLFGGSALAYNFWYQNPEKVVTDAIVHALTSTTGTMSGTLEAEDDEFKLKISMAANVDDKVHGSMNVSLDYTAKKEDVSFSAKGEGVMGDNGDLYVKINDARELVKSIEDQSAGAVDFSVFEDVIKKIDGQWVKISKDDLGDVDENYGKAQECIADAVKSIKDDKAIRHEVGKLYTEHRFLVVGDKIGSRDINGQGSLGYKVTSDEKETEAFFKGLNDTQLGKKLIGCDDSIDFEKLVTDSTSEEADDSTTEIWVSRFGHTITEMKVTSEGDTKGTMVMNPVFGKNEAVSIPADTITISELKKDIEKAYTQYYESLYESYYSDYDTTDAEALFN